MAKPVPFKQVIQSDSREELQRRIQNAPIAHADAVLSAYELLQELHESGTLDLLRGVLGAGDVLVNHVTSLVVAPDSLRAMRNLILLGQALGGVDPDRLHQAIGGLQATMQTAEPDPPSLFALGKRMMSKDGRRGLSTAISFLELLGNGRNKRV